MYTSKVKMRYKINWKLKRETILLDENSEIKNNIVVSFNS